MDSRILTMDSNDSNDGYEEEEIMEDLMETIQWMILMFDINTTTIEQVTEPANCSICLEDLQEEDFASTLSCQHTYHALCISEWLKRKANCPYCRHDVTAFSVDDLLFENLSLEDSNSDYF